MLMENKPNNQLNNITLDDLYGHLKNTDVSLQRKLSNKDISDKDYFFCSLLDNLVSNTQSLIINKVSSNLDSIGVDINCKNIIETICVLKYISSVPISDDKAKLFRFIYPFKGLEEINSLFVSDDDKKVIYNILLAEKNKVTNLIETQLKLKKGEAENKLNEFNSPYFYLKKTLNEKIDFNQLLKKYPVYNEENNHAYEFFTSLNNTYFVNDDNNKLLINNLRNKYIDIVIDYATRYLNENHFINVNLPATSFSKDFINNPYFKVHLENSSWVNGAFDFIEENFAIINNKKDKFSLYVYEKLNKLCIDMFFCLSLGLADQVINKFNSLVELASIDNYLSLCPSEEKEKIKSGLSVLTRARISSFLTRTKQTNNFIYEKDLKDLFDSYYKEKYKIDDFEKFKDEFINNDLYFIDKDIKSFSPLIKKLTDTLNNPNFSNNFTTLYKLTSQLSYASRYFFISGQLILDTIAQKELQIVYDYLIESLKHKEKILSGNNIKVSAQDAYDIFLAFSSNQKTIVSENIAYITSDTKK